MRTYLCFDDFATVFSKFFRLSLLSIGFFTLTLFLQSLLFFLFFLLFYLGKFFLGVGNIDLSDIIEINVNLLRSCFTYTLGFIHHNLVNEFGKHQIGNFRRIFILAYQRNKMLNIHNDTASHRFHCALCIQRIFLHLNTYIGNRRICISKKLTFGQGRYFHPISGNQGYFFAIMG